MKLRETAASTTSAFDAARLPCPVVNRRRLLVLAAAAGLGLAACGSGAADDAAPVSTATTSAAPLASEPVDGGSAVVPADVPAALQFSAPLVGGGDIELTTLAGRPVLLWFWAPW